MEEDEQAQREREERESVDERNPRETAAQLEDESGERAPAAWERRLEAMEERQRRIEDMLLEIAQALKR